MDKKVLLIVNSLVGGGAERVCVHLANSMSEKYDVDVVTLYGRSNITMAPRVHVFDLGVKADVGRAAKLVQILRAKARLNDFVEDREKNEPYSLIAVHLTASQVIASLSSIANRCLYVHHALPDEIQGQYPALMLGYLKHIFQKGQSISVSEGVRQQAIESYGIDPKRIVTIYNAIPLEPIRSGMREILNFERPFILCVGRLVAEKRFDRMLDVFAAGGFKEKYDLVFLGEGSLREELYARAEALGIAQVVHFRGYVDNPYPWMRKSSVMVMTSDREALPTVLVEGLMAGARVVSADCDFGPREILVGKLSRYLVRPDCIEEYVDVIWEAFETYPQLEDDYFERFDPSEIADQYVKHYKTVISNKEGWLS